MQAIFRTRNWIATQATSGLSLPGGRPEVAKDLEAKFPKVNLNHLAWTVNEVTGSPLNPPDLLLLGESAYVP